MRGSVRGYVVSSADRNPVQDATVMAVRGPGVTGASPAQLPTTDRDGSFFVDALRAGEWVLSIRGPSGNGAMAVVHVLDNSVSDVTIEIADIRLPCADRGITGNGSVRGTLPRPTQDNTMLGSIRGYVVRDGDGTPIADAAITIVSGAGPAPDLSPLTDAEGSFSLDGLPEGRWVLRATGPAGETGETAAHVVEGAVTETTITLISRPPSRRR